LLVLVLAGVLALAPWARADDNDQRTINHNDTTTNDTNYNDRAGTAPDNTTTTESNEVTRGVFGSPFTVTPAVGALGFQDPTGTYTSRITEGLLLNFDAGSAIMRGSSGQIKLGLESGLLYSHLGSSGSNFFGSNAGVQNQESANSFLVPIELTAGYALTDSFLATLNLGTNMLYRSIPGSMLVGRSDNTGGTSVDFFPSAGLELGWTAGSVVGIKLRGDYIPTPLDDMFTATLGATFALA